MLKLTLSEHQMIPGLRRGGNVGEEEEEADEGPYRHASCLVKGRNLSKINSSARINK
jgi:hypothetical protein